MIGEVKGNTKKCRICAVKIPRRSETIVKIPMENGIEGEEGIIEKTEITEGVYLASSLIKVIDNQAITSILNTRETDVVIRIPEIRWEEYKVHEEEHFQISVGSLTATGSGARNRTQGVLEALQLDHQNPEERRVMEETYKDYQDIFYLPGDRLSCMTTVKQSMWYRVRAPYTLGRIDQPSRKRQK
jgi:hypothetical protein